MMDRGWWSMSAIQPGSTGQCEHLVSYGAHQFRKVAARQIGSPDRTLKNHIAYKGAARGFLIKEDMARSVSRHVANCKGERSKVKRLTMYQSVVDGR